MSTLAKFFLGLIVVVMLLCLVSAVGGFFAIRSGGRFLADRFEPDPAQAADVASRIADYSVPAGFGDPYSVHLLGFSLVGYTGNDHHSHIYLCQFPKYLSLNQAEIERQFGQATNSKWSDRPARMAVVDQRTVTIRGQEVTLVVSEGTNSEGNAYREVNALFQGKGGQALVNMSAPLQSWDETVVDQFLASIQ